MLAAGPRVVVHYSSLADNFVEFAAAAVVMLGAVDLVQVVELVVDRKLVFVAVAS